MLHLLFKHRICLHLLQAAHNLSAFTRVTPVVHQPDTDHGSVFLTKLCHACISVPHPHMTAATGVGKGEGSV